MNKPMTTIATAASLGVLAFTLAGCGDGGQTTNAQPEAPPAPKISVKRHFNLPLTRDTEVLEYTYVDKPDELNVVVRGVEAVGLAVVPYSPANDAKASQPVQYDHRIEALPMDRDTEAIDFTTPEAPGKVFRVVRGVEAVSVQTLDIQPK